MSFAYSLYSHHRSQRSPSARAYLRRWKATYSTWNSFLHDSVDFPDFTFWCQTYDVDKIPKAIRKVLLQLSELKSVDLGGLHLTPSMAVCLTSLPRLESITFGMGVGLDDELGGSDGREMRGFFQGS